MKLLQIIGTFLLIALLSPEALGCTCVDPPIKKRYRNAKAVFVGGVYPFDQDDIPNIQNYRPGLPVLLVKRKWKGIKKELVAIDFDFPDSIGACPSFLQFEDGSDYLVFAYGNNLAVNVVCSDTHKLSAGYNQAVRDISKLDSRWFRFNATVWPF